jgi:hypothetical protein
MLGFGVDVVEMKDFGHVAKGCLHTLDGAIAIDAVVSFVLK